MPLRLNCSPKSSKCRTADSKRIEERHCGMDNNAKIAALNANGVPQAKPRNTVTVQSVSNK